MTRFEKHLAQLPPERLAKKITKAASGKRHLSAWLASLVYWDVYGWGPMPESERSRNPVRRLMRRYKAAQCWGRDSDLYQAMIAFGYDEKTALHRIWRKRK
jgi:hypothetical protein